VAGVNRLRVHTTNTGVLPDNLHVSTTPGPETPPAPTPEVPATPIPPAHVLPPKASPDQTIVVTVSPDVTQHLAPQHNDDGGWLTQPWATVVAALIALAAAGMAWKGVLKTVASAATESEKTRTSAESIASAARDAEEKRIRHGQQLELLARAVPLTLQLFQDAFVMNSHLKKGEEIPAARQNSYFDNWVAASILQEMLDLHGLVRSAAAIADFIYRAMDLSRSSEAEAPPEKLSEVRKRMLQVFRNEASSLGAKEAGPEEPAGEAQPAEGAPADEAPSKDEK
jgi:hypothetical protein